MGIYSHNKGGEPGATDAGGELKQTNFHFYKNNYLFLSDHTEMWFIEHIYFIRYQFCNEHNISDRIVTVCVLIA